MSVRPHTTCPSGTVCQTAATVNQLAALGCRSRLSSEAQSDHRAGTSPSPWRLLALARPNCTAPIFLTSFILVSGEFRSGSIELFEL